MSLQAARVTKSADAYRSIGEAASELGLETHVLRYWESKFPKVVKPVKRPDGRRLFRRRDLEALRAIQLLVHERGMTLRGAAAFLNEQGVERVLKGEAKVAGSTVEPAATPDYESPVRELQKSVEAAFDTARDVLPKTATRARLSAMLDDLTDIKQRLDAARERNAA